MLKWTVRALVIAMFVCVAAPLAAGDEKSDAVLGQVALNVADLARAEKYYGEVLGFKRAEAAGSKVRFVDLGGDNPPTIVFFNDPDGYEIELYQAPSQ